jgi:hypothetical protein
MLWDIFFIMTLCAHCAASSRRRHGVVRVRFGNTFRLRTVAQSVVHRKCAGTSARGSRACIYTKFTMKNFTYTSNFSDCYTCTVTFVIVGCGILVKSFHADVRHEVLHIQTASRRAFLQASQT